MSGRLGGFHQQQLIEADAGMAIGEFAHDFGCQTNPLWTAHRSP